LPAMKLNNEGVIKMAEVHFGFKSEDSRVMPSKDFMNILATTEETEVLHDCLQDSSLARQCRK
jgi:hypothetical protein